MTQVCLSNGVVLAGDAKPAGPNVLWVYIRDNDEYYNNFERLSGLMTPGNTAVISRVQDGAIREYTGYTRLTKIRVYTRGLLCARMAKG